MFIEKVMNNVFNIPDKNSYFKLIKRGYMV